MTGNSKTAPIDLFPGQLVGCTTAVTTSSQYTATARFMPKYTSSTIEGYHSSRVAHKKITTLEEFDGRKVSPSRSVGWFGDVHYYYCYCCCCCTASFEDPFFKCTSPLPPGKV